MEKYFGKFHFRLASLIIGLMIGSAFFVSCEDDYIYDEKEPEWLGASIYDYLKDDGNFNYYVRLIEDAGYKEVLAKTGSKTLFVADDAAFDKFFQNNKWGVSSYDGLSFAQKNLLLKFGMVNNAYLIQTLSNYYYTELRKNQAIRHETAVSVYDSIPFEKGSDLPNTESWDQFRDKGLLLLKDHTNWTLTHFLQKHMDVVGLTDKDFYTITNHKKRETGDAFILDKKVIKRDVVCKNGYINILDGVLVPPSNIAQHLVEDKESSIISRLLDRFSAPYIYPDATAEYKELNPTFNDTLYVKKYFTVPGGGGASVYPNRQPVSADERLVVDPGWNRYWKFTGEGGMQADMEAMFAPTDSAMTEYFNNGSGKILKERYHEWDSVPNDIVALLLNRHLRNSLLATLPSRFYNMNDTENSPIKVAESNVVRSYIGLNGVVYHTNKVFPPDDYVSIYGPVLFSKNATIFNWIIRKADFRLYINSLESNYSFFVPTDEYMKGYIDPIAMSGDGVKGALKYWYNKKTKTVNATVYDYDVVNNVIGDSLTVIENDAFIQNRLLDLLDNHIVVNPPKKGDNSKDGNSLEDGDGYYLSKGGNVVHVEGTGMTMKIKGGGQFERNDEVKVTNIYTQENGITYFIDKPIQTPLKSVYKVLSETPAFSEFFDLINGFDSKSTHSILVKAANRSGLDFNIKFLNTYNYTVYVPTNEAIRQAFADTIIRPWESRDGIVGIDNLTGAEYTKEELKLERFLRYHFQDRSVYINGKATNGIFQSATLKDNDLPTKFNTYKNKYYKLGVVSNGGTIDLITENNSTAHVVTDNGLYNILVRDYIFNKLPSSFGTIDGETKGAFDFSASRIETSSSAVIHQIDNVLTFE